MASALLLLGALDLAGAYKSFLFSRTTLFCNVINFFCGLAEVRKKIIEDCSLKLHTVSAIMGWHFKGFFLVVARACQRNVLHRQVANHK